MEENRETDLLRSLVDQFANDADERLSKPTMIV